MTNPDQPSTATSHATPTRLAETQLDELVRRLDLPEKVRLLAGATVFTLHGEPKIALREMAFSDGPAGVRGLKFTGGDAVALFPNATLVAGGWDEEAAYQVGQIVAEEAERQHIEVVLDARLWRRWDERSGGWSTLSEGGELLVARGLGDVRGRVQLP